MPNNKKQVKSRVITERRAKEWILNISMGNRVVNTPFIGYRSSYLQKNSLMRYQSAQSCFME